MPTADEHKLQSRRNEELGAKLERDYPDWSITAYFYAAVHYTRAWLAIRGYASDDYNTHKKAEDALTEADFGAIDAYKDLYDFSRQMRYDCPDESDALRLLPEAKQALEDVKAYVSKTHFE